MRTKIVAMSLIPGASIRGTPARSDLGYSIYSRATWEWWCGQHSVEFVPLDQPLGGEMYMGLPPTIQRWLAPEILSQQFGGTAQVAMVDADTMIRWDTPDFF